ncbi:MAG TPA: hypothetical protein VFY71_09015 [Planctomycetota bacterium]|nr:hypothetical protein [Planctomycetota bacterium]
MRTLLALALLVPAASAGVIVVDSAGRHGTDFTKLGDAIAAAVTGDVILVRSGTYDGQFKIGDQAISIVADADAKVHLINSVLGDPGLRALWVGSHVPGVMVVSGLTLTTPVGGGEPLLAFGDDVPGSQIFIQDCEVPSAAAVGMEMTNGSPVTVIRCNVTGSSAILQSGQPIAEGNPAMSVFEGPLAVFGGFLSGGDGLVAGFYGGLPFDGQEGGSGAQIKNGSSALKVFSGTICVGGLGGDGAKPGGFCLAPGDGGDGIQVVAGGNVHVAGLLGTGDLPGTGAVGCGQVGEVGNLLDAVPPGELPTWLPGNPVTLTATRVARENEKVTISISGALGQQVRVLVGFEPKFSYEPEHSGVAVVEPALVLDPGPVSVTGEATFHGRVPELGPGVESMFVYLQVQSTNQAGLVTLGMPSVVLLLDGQF